MRVIIVGLGVQGNKRLEVAGQDVVATVDPINKIAKYSDIRDVPLKNFEAALLCIPDEPKIEMIEYLLSNKKHVLVEKPILTNNLDEILKLKKLSEKFQTTCYTAYNHRFEPHFIKMKKLIETDELGKIYTVRIFYGNGTAKLVKNSPWRDKGTGVLTDLGSHLLDIISFWFNKNFTKFKVYSANSFENKSFDHINFGIDSSDKDPLIQLEVSLLSWKNNFYADVVGEHGSAHISSLCKWGPSSFKICKRKLPSGIPDQTISTLCQSDPTWKDEFNFFKKICRTGTNNLDHDIWINNILLKLENELK